MSYTPTQWQTGDTITAEKLNNMESGIAAANEGEILHITATETENGGATFSVSASEAWAAIQAGKIPVMKFAPRVGEAFTLLGYKERPNAQEVTFYNKEDNSNTYPISITLDSVNQEWIYDKYTHAMDLSWLTRYDGQGSNVPYKVLGFNIDQYPSWETVEYVVPMGALVSPLILAACNAAASGKTTVAANFSGDMASQLHGLLVTVAQYVRNGRGAGFLYDLDGSTGQHFYARADSVYSDNPADKDIESASFKAIILPTATDYYEISCAAYAAYDYSQGDSYSGYFSVTAEKIEPTFVPMS